MHQNRAYLLAEFIAIFFLPPLLLSFYSSGRGLIFILWGATLAAFLVTRKPDYAFTGDWNWRAVNWLILKPMLLRFVFFAALLTLFTLLHDRERLLNFPRDRPYFWALVMLLYPLLSVIPQEFLYRTFIMRRYTPLFNRPVLLVLASALAFGWMHIVLHNWVAVTFSFIGGIFFAQTYRTHRSLAMACIEHALYGCFIFTIGLGWYFYHARFQ